MLSPNAGITNWRVIDPSDPSQEKLYHLTFDDNLSDQLNPLIFYKLGSHEKLSLKNLHPSIEIDTATGKLASREIPQLLRGSGLIFQHRLITLKRG